MDGSVNTVQGLGAQFFILNFLFAYLAVQFVCFSQMETVLYQ